MSRGTIIIFCIENANKLKPASPAKSFVLDTLQVKTKVNIGIFRNSIESKTEPVWNENSKDQKVIVLNQ